MNDTATDQHPKEKPWQIFYAEAQEAMAYLQPSGQTNAPQSPPLSPIDQVAKDTATAIFDIVPKGHILAITQGVNVLLGSATKIRHAHMTFYMIDSDPQNNRPETPIIGNYDDERKIRTNVLTHNAHTDPQTIITKTKELINDFESVDYYRLRSDGKSVEPAIQIKSINPQTGQENILEPEKLLKITSIYLKIEQNKPHILLTAGVDRDRPDIIKHAINKGGSVGKFNYLYSAVKNSKPAAFRYLMTCPSIHVNGFVGDRPIVAAAEKGNIEAIDALLAHPNILVDATKNDGMTALMAAADSGQIEAAKRLLQDPRVNPKAVDKTTRDALSLATDKKDYAMIDLLFDDGRSDPTRALFSAIKLQDPDLVRKILSHPDMDINKTITIHHNPFHCSENSPLNYAAEIGNPEIFKILFDHPEINPAQAADKYGFTPLINACRQTSDGHHDIVKMILNDPNKAIDPTAHTHQGNNALDFCVVIDNSRAGALLIADGRLSLDDVNEKTKSYYAYNLSQLSTQIIPTQAWRTARQSAALAGAQPQPRKQ